MKSITIRELHLQTGHWVRHAAATGGIVVTDRGHRLAALVPADAAPVGRPLPDREAACPHFGLRAIDVIASP